MVFPGTWQQNRPKGFTLLEVVLVSVITALLALAVAPVIRYERANFNLKHTANCLAENIRETQQMSLGDSSTNFYIQFYSSSVNYYFIKKSSFTGDFAVRKVYLPRSVKIDATTFYGNELIFNINGVTTRGGTVNLRDQVSGRYKYVVVASITGRVRVSDYPPQ